jgi:hypothetical protein
MHKAKYDSPQARRAAYQRSDAHTRKVDNDVGLAAIILHATLADKPRELRQREEQLFSQPARIRSEDLERYRAMVHEVTGREYSAVLVGLLGAAAGALLGKALVDYFRKD